MTSPLCSFSSSSFAERCRAASRVACAQEMGSQASEQARARERHAAYVAKAVGELDAKRSGLASSFESTTKIILDQTVAAFETVSKNQQEGARKRAKKSNFDLTSALSMLQSLNND